MGKLRASVIGLGHQAEEDHIPGIMESQQAELSAICDLDEARVKEMQKQVDVNGYTDCHRLIDAENLDFVIVTTPHDAHKEVIEAVAKRGLHVLKEKPFVLSQDVQA